MNPKAEKSRIDNAEVERVRRHVEALHVRIQALEQLTQDSAEDSFENNAA